MKIRFCSLSLLCSVTLLVLGMLWFQLGSSAEKDKDLNGMARVIDGDTLSISGERVRLAGLDAPKAKQSCIDENDWSWKCGAEATKWLRNATRGRTVTCSTDGRDRYGRFIGRCEASGTDLNRGLISAGLAVSYMGNGLDNLTELRARFEGKGIWKGDFVEPAEYRASR